METHTKPPLFAGETRPLGGLSNERELARLCPLDFKRDNPWSNYASLVFFGGANIANWNWKTPDMLTRQHQLSRFRSLLHTSYLSHQDKEAVAGWMLSEMLTEVPEYLSVKKD